MEGSDAGDLGHYALAFVFGGILLCTCTFAAMAVWSACVDSEGPRQELPLSGERTAHSFEAASPLELPQAEVCRQLCPALVVPRGIEFVFAVREVITTEKQQSAFPIVDMTGQALCHVYVSEKTGETCGIWINFINEEPLALIRTERFHAARDSVAAGEPLCEIYAPTGEVFCYLHHSDADRGTNGPSAGYVLKKPDGEVLLHYQGDFKEKAIHAIGPSGTLMCATRRCAAGSLDNASTPHYEVVVAQGDAGLLLCGLLAVDKVQNQQEQASSL